MIIKVVDLDLDSIDDITLNNLVKDIESIDLSIGYSRSDLESIEGKVPGVFTDIEDFDFRELPTGLSKVNFNIIDKRLNEIRNLIGQGINNRYHSYINTYGKLISELNGILDTINRVKDVTPTPVVDDIDSVHLYNNEYDNHILTKTVFSTNEELYTKIRLLRDSSKNHRINDFNYKIEDMLGSSHTSIDGKPEYRYSILKRVLGITEITYSNAITLFSNSNDLVEFINNTTTDLIDILSTLKEIISWDFTSDDIQASWVSTRARLDIYTSIANDSDSLRLIKFLSMFRYFDNYK